MLLIHSILSQMLQLHLYMQEFIERQKINLIANNIIYVTLRNFSNTGWVHA